MACKTVLKDLISHLLSRESEPALHASGAVFRHEVTALRASEATQRVSDPQEVLMAEELKIFRREDKALRKMNNTIFLRCRLSRECAPAPQQRSRPLQDHLEQVAMINRMLENSLALVSPMLKIWRKQRARLKKANYRCAAIPVLCYSTFVAVVDICFDPFRSNTITISDRNEKRFFSIRWWIVTQLDRKLANGDFLQLTPRRSGEQLWIDIGENPFSF